MAVLTLVDSQYTSVFQNAKCYYVDGEITMKEVSFINSSYENTILILKNTKEQNPGVISYFNPTKVLISVLGGLDYLSNPKYNNKNYIERTAYNPKELSNIIREFQKIEKKLDSNWTDLEKSMYIYNLLSRTIKYKREFDSGYANGLNVFWSLNCILYRNSSSAGFSMIFKELMDRNNISCDYQFMDDEYSWNILSINGKNYGIDLTRDAVKNTLFNHFGREDSNQFYSDNHRTIKDFETVKYNLSVLTYDELSNAYAKISDVEHEVFMDVFKEVKTIDGGHYLIAELGSIEHVNYYLQGKVSHINYFYAHDNVDLYTELTRDAIDSLRSNNYVLGRNNSLKEGMPRFNKYTRKDGSSFIIFPMSAKIERGIKKYHLIEIDSVNGKEMLKRINISSENNLERMDDVSSKRLIADYLLSEYRLKDRLENYGGYIGYIASTTKDYFNSEGGLSINNNLEK